MTGFRIERPVTAFSTAPASGKKRPRVKDDAHLKWLRTLPCVVSGRFPVEAAHIRYSEPSYAKRETGMAEKPDDRWCLPLHPDMHREQHAACDERAWWASKGIDPLKLAMLLYASSEDDEAAILIIRAARLL